MFSPQTLTRGFGITLIGIGFLQGALYDYQHRNADIFSLKLFIGVLCIGAFPAMIIVEVIRSIL